MFTIGSICAGMGMHLHGLKQLGGNPVWAIEMDEAIAHVYRKNHPCVHQFLYRCPVQKVKPESLPPVDILVATPSCKNASRSKGKFRGETIDDYHVALSIAWIIRTLHPKVVLLENVPQYYQFQSFERITKELIQQGYSWQWQKLSLKDFGIPQNRERGYGVGVKDRGTNYALSPITYHLSPITHPGWYAAIEDLIPELEETTLTTTQQRVLERRGRPQICLLRRVGGGRGSDRPWRAHEPSFTIRAFGRGCDYHWHQADVVIGNKVYALSPRACLRLFGDRETADSIWLPPQKSLAMEVVGNGASWVIFKELLQSTGIITNAAA